MRTSTSSGRWSDGRLSTALRPGPGRRAVAPGAWTWWRRSRVPSRGSVPGGSCSSPQRRRLGGQLPPVRPRRAPPGGGRSPRGRVGCTAQRGRQPLARVLVATPPTRSCVRTSPSLTPSAPRSTPDRATPRERSRSVRSPGTARTAAAHPSSGVGSSRPSWRARARHRREVAGGARRARSCATSHARDQRGRLAQRAGTTDRRREIPDARGTPSRPAPPTAGAPSPVCSPRSRRPSEHARFGASRSCSLVRVVFGPLGC